jgi:hypothetical protein
MNPRMNDEDLSISLHTGKGYKFADEHFIVNDFGLKFEKLLFVLSTQSH